MGKPAKLCITVPAMATAAPIATTYSGDGGINDYNDDSNNTIEDFWWWRHITLCRPSGRPAGRSVNNYTNGPPEPLLITEI